MSGAAENAWDDSTDQTSAFLDEFQSLVDQQGVIAGTYVRYKRWNHAQVPMVVGDETDGILPMLGQAFEWGTEAWFGSGASEVATNKQASTDNRQTYRPSLQVLVDGFKVYYSDNPVFLGVLARIEKLNKYASEDPLQEPPTLNSLIALIHFLQIYRSPVQPTLVLTHDGHLRSEWSKDRHNRLAIEFLDDDEVRFVLFFRNSLWRKRVTRLSGSTSILSIFQDISDRQAKKFGAKGSS